MKTQGPSGSYRLILATLAPLVAFGLQTTFWDAIRPYVWFLFFPAVFFSSWIGGLLGGLVATVLSTGLAWYFFIPPTHSFALDRPVNLVSIGVFMGMGTLFSLSHGRLRKANKETAEALGAVHSANEELQAQKAELLTQEAELLAQQEELKAQQTELETKNAEVERANRLKSEFLANMSHELRTPLNSIIGFSDLLLEDLRTGGDPRRVQYVEDVLASGRHLLNLINDILDLSKIEAGHLELQTEVLKPAGAVADACAIVEATARHKRIALRQAVRTARSVRADRNKLRQILLNLLSNSVKFGPEGSTVEVGAADAGGFVRFYVRDEGPGIDPSLLPRIFEAFVQGESPLVKKHQGTGLGLAISKRLVELHGGTIEVRSEGRGTVSEFTLPLAEGAGSGRAAEPSAEKALVLLVEEDRDAARALREWLEGEGCRVAEAVNGEDAVELAVRQHPTAIVLDPAADRRDGFRLLDELKRREATRDIPVVVTSLPAPAGWLAKPVEAERLLWALAGAAEAGSASEPPLVLVIDDDPGARRVLRGLLEPTGYRVIEADGGRSGLELATARQPDLCIVDLLMPDMSGFEVVAALAGEPRTRQLPVVVLTAADLSQADSRRLKEHVRALARKGTTTREELLAAVRRAMGRVPKATGAGETILVVDDHDLNRELARTILERRGYRVLVAEDGDSGVELARRERPALVLMDLAMPGKDGYAAAREIKAAPDMAGIPVVALTALAMRGDEQKAYAAGFDAYVTKPIDRKVLIDTVRRFVTPGASRTETTGPA